MGNTLDNKEAQRILNSKKIALARIRFFATNIYFYLKIQLQNVVKIGVARTLGVSFKY